jgi:hypothetical protein
MCLFLWLVTKNRVVATVAVVFGIAVPSLRSVTPIGQNSLSSSALTFTLFPWRSVASTGHASPVVA